VGGKSYCYHFCPKITQGAHDTLRPPTGSSEHPLRLPRLVYGAVASPNFSGKFFYYGTRAILQLLGRITQWLDQLRNDSTRPIGDLWRRHVDRGHGGARRDGLAGYANMMMMMMIT